MAEDNNNRRHFLGKVAGFTIGAGGGFAASFPLAKGTRSLRGADFPQQKNLDNAKAEKQSHQLILDFLDYEREIKSRRPRIREKEFKEFLNSEKELSKEAFSSTVACFKTLSGNTNENELRKVLQRQISNYGKDIEDLEERKKQHVETQDLTVGNWLISIFASGFVGLFGWFIGARIDTNLELSDEKKAQQELIDSRK